MIKLVLALALFLPEDAWAIIPHDYSGVYAHQIGHVFLAVSMAVFVYFIYRKGLIKNPGWKYLALSGILLVLWNIHTFVGHFVEYLVRPESFIDRDDPFKGHITINLVTVNYIIYRLDNLILVPCIIFFYLGVKRHLENSREEK